MIKPEMRERKKGYKEDKVIRDCVLLYENKCKNMWWKK